MALMLTLKVETRDTKSDLADIRKAGKIPAVFYGKKEASTPISIPRIDFLKVWKEAGESSVITLETPDGTKDSLIQDVDIDPISGAPRHADFYVFDKNHKLEIELPIEFVGIAPAVKELGGILVKVVHELSISALPKDLPHNISVDISSLKTFDDQILAKDIPLPNGVEITINPEDVIALVSAPREEKEEESAPVDLSEIEVEKKGKEESEGEPTPEGDSSAKE